MAGIRKYVLNLYVNEREGRRSNMIYIQPRDTQLGSHSFLSPRGQNAEYQAFKVSPVFFLLTPSSSEAGTPVE